MSERDFLPTRNEYPTCAHCGTQQIEPLTGSAYKCNVCDVIYEPVGETLDVDPICWYFRGQLDARLIECWAIWASYEDFAPGLYNPIRKAAINATSLFFGYANDDLVKQAVEGIEPSNQK